MKHIHTFESFLKDETDVKLNEGFMSELDIIRQESKDVNDFIKNALQEYPQLKGEEKFLEDVWNTSQEMGN